MTERRILGIDPGERRLGVALSDPLGIIAQPHAVLDASDDVIERIRRLVEQHDVTEIVVGLPLSLSGVEGAAALAARALAARLSEAVEIPVVFHDERFTTVQAERALLEADVRRSDRKKRRDMVAAAVMLQSHLDAERER